MPQKQILVVEDNDINRAMLREILTPQYVVLEAENGKEALAILADHAEEIALILLDIIMPVMDGYTFLNLAKAEPAISAIPVIVTTQSDSESDEVSALAHGASDYVPKPYNPQVILHRVASIIHLRETAAMINQFQYDQLTGLYSKEFFYRRVNESLLKNPEQEYDIICSDIENFKLINDIFGVPAGDRLLCGVADMYRKLVGEDGICGRFNADQFACLVERSSDYTDELFVQNESQLNMLSNTKSVVLKWGVYAVKDRTISVEQMCDRAFLASSSIKGQYGKHFAVYDETLRNKLLREQEITDSMEWALSEEQFLVYLQPKYATEGEGRLAGAEALVRWNHPEWGFLSPAEFIPLFEKNGFITKLDQFVWERSCAILRQWIDQGYPRIPISVNVSRADIYQANLADVLVGFIEKYQLSPSLLHLEITESAYTENQEQIIDTLDHLRGLGFIIEMDDFGTGYSSLNMLNEMPLDILKLDMKFIQSETAKPAEEGILRFIMGLARWMELSVVAEGVETKEQWERLCELGCDYVQGYYFAKPMPAREFEKLLKSEEEAAAQRKADCCQDKGHRPQVLLVADEDEQYRREVRETFESKYRVLEAGDAESAISCIVSHEDQLAAVILSLTLHERGGFSVLEILRKEKNAWDISVIATAPADEELEEKALVTGADDFAFKPHSQKSLWRRVMNVRGITSFRKQRQMLQDDAYRDYLTKLLNRRGLDAAVEALQKEDFPAAVYLFDLDNLKQINDSFGHAEGDRMLKDFSEVLHAHTRSSDIISRFGGDEFVVIMKKLGSEETALKKGEEICKAFQNHYVQEGFSTACSGGVTISGSGEETLPEMLGRADEALYGAKSNNKGGCCLWKEPKI
ncbi:EAL domain-containing protein [Anaerovorax odorimutans]|uniref:Stage 0 sporulation protein A homolog n=1 Tax=Anaerovorax odorimutans TaxID=109327 RepID=A0ABT1RKQ8_9FIRM|nr:EAL domain-containing protein [Anaerovorax odorimutans]MCQ4635763.1 EAL domain-containing protein [Anaerovorax odorimutans]